MLPSSPIARRRMLRSPTSQALTSTALLTRFYPDNAGVPGVIRTNPAGAASRRMPDCCPRDCVPPATFPRSWADGVAPGSPQPTKHRRQGRLCIRLDTREIDRRGHATGLFTERPFAATVARRRIRSHRPHRPTGASFAGIIVDMSVLRTCANCGATNRVPARRLGDTGRCGSCKSPLPPVDTPLDADPQIFQEIVSQSPLPILVDFWASWCAPCRMAAPEVAALAREMAGRAIVLKVDTETHPELSARFRVQSIPNFVVLRNGNVVMQRAGVAPRAEMRRWLQVEGASTV